MGMHAEQTWNLKIAVLSLADINNYGDKFFPYIFRSELKARFPNAEIGLYTNSEYHCELYDTSKYSLPGLADYDAVILAGGDTIQRLDEENWNDIYGSSTLGRKPSDIIFQWLALDKPYKAYFSVGVHPQMQEHRQDILNMLTRLDYLSVRGGLSKKIIEGSLVYNYNQIRIVPDLGWLFAKYLDRMEPDLPETGLTPGNYMVFEVFYEFDDEILRFSAKALSEFQSETNVKVMLLPIIHTKSKRALSTWNDYYPLSKIQEYAGGAFLLMPDQLSIANVGFLLKNAKFYLGSSMHGAVTCLSYGIPAGNILTWTAPKLQELHGARMRADCFINHWGKLPGLLRQLNREAEDNTNRGYGKIYADYMRHRLSQELDYLCLEIQKRRFL